MNIQEVLSTEVFRMTTNPQSRYLGGRKERETLDFAEESFNSETKWREIIFHFHFSDTKGRVFKRVQEMESVSLSLRHFSQQDDQYWNYEKV